MRILAVNVLALVMLGSGMLFLGKYQERLIQAELDALTFEARIFASALGEGAVLEAEDDISLLAPELARSMVRRLIEVSDSRTRLFDESGELLADSRLLTGRGGKIQIENIPPLLPPQTMLKKFWQLALGWMGQALTESDTPLYVEPSFQLAGKDPLARQAMQGNVATQLWRLPNNKGLLLGVAVPVQAYKQVLGAVVVTRPSTKIDATLAAVRGDVLKIFCAVMGFTILLSLYLARTIVKPLQTLARAVRDVNQDQAQVTGIGGAAAILANRRIPDLTGRGDEVGDLSRALRDMTAALATRIGAIERFAADVAHELKNPLTSLRSAVETTARVSDPVLLARLMAVINDDVERMDRLITDIASSSRLDAELSRAAASLIAVKAMVEMVVELYTAIEVSEGRKLVQLVGEIPESLHVMGVTDRLTQVLRNLVENARSFTPADGTVRLSASTVRQQVQIMVEDDGPGIPPAKLDSIFDRFYSERPSGEKFGKHSGLGLSIARQIVEAHHGNIWAENRTDADGTILGARFIIALPLSISTIS